MRTWVGPSAISHFAGVVTAACLCGAGPAWAGDGGSDAGAFQQALNTVCGLVGMTSCPQVPTLTQVILEISSLENTPPDFIRGPQGSFQGFGGLCAVNSGISLPVGSQNDAIDSVNQPAPSSLGISYLRRLTPLAFTTDK